MTMECECDYHEPGEEEEEVCCPNCPMRAVRHTHKGGDDEQDDLGQWDEAVERL